MAQNFKCIYTNAKCSCAGLVLKNLHVPILLHTFPPAFIHAFPRWVEGAGLAICAAPLNMLPAFTSRAGSE